MGRDSHPSIGILTGRPLGVRVRVLCIGQLKLGVQWLGQFSFGIEVLRMGILALGLLWVRPEP